MVWLCLFYFNYNLYRVNDPPFNLNDKLYIFLNIYRVFFVRITKRIWFKWCIKNILSSIKLLQSLLARPSTNFKFFMWPPVEINCPPLLSSGTNVRLNSSAFMPIHDRQLSWVPFERYWVALPSTQQKSQLPFYKK